MKVATGRKFKTHVEFDLTTNRPVSRERVESWLAAHARPYAVSMHDRDTYAPSESADEDGWAYVDSIDAVEITESKQALVELFALATDVTTALATAEETAGAFSCGDADVIVELMRYLGRDNVADEWLAAHSRSDDDESDAHHDRYIDQQETMLRMHLAQLHGQVGIDALGWDDLNDLHSELHGRDVAATHER